MTVILNSNSAAPAQTQAAQPQPLSLRGLSVAYGERPAVWNVSLEVPAASLTTRAVWGRA